MFCSRSKSGQPNSSDELVPQVLSTTYELIGCVGENSASCDCRHRHKSNSTALSVTTHHTTDRSTFSSQFPFLYLLLLEFTLWPCTGEYPLHPKRCGFDPGADNSSNLILLFLITNMALSALKSLLNKQQIQMSAKTSQWELASLMDT